MRLFAVSFSTLASLAISFAACSSKTKEPPVSTTDGTDPAPTAGGRTEADGGEAGAAPVSDDAGSEASTTLCASGGCSGCCNALQQCVTPSTAACGILGAPCQACPSPTTCIGGTCQ